MYLQRAHLMNYMLPGLHGSKMSSSDKGINILHPLTGLLKITRQQDRSSRSSRDCYQEDTQSRGCSPNHWRQRHPSIHRIRSASGRSFEWTSRVSCSAWSKWLGATGIHKHQPDTWWLQEWHRMLNELFEALFSFSKTNNFLVNASITKTCCGKSSN